MQTQKMSKTSFYKLFTFDTASSGASEAIAFKKSVEALHPGFHVRMRVESLDKDRVVADVIWLREVEELDDHGNLIQK